MRQGDQCTVAAFGGVKDKADRNHLASATTALNPCYGSALATHIESDGNQCSQIQLCCSFAVEAAAASVLQQETLVPCVMSDHNLKLPWQKMQRT